VLIGIGVAAVWELAGDIRGPFRVHRDLGIFEGFWFGGQSDM